MNKLSGSLTVVLLEPAFWNKESSGTAPNEPGRLQICEEAWDQWCRVYGVDRRADKTKQGGLVKQNRRVMQRVFPSGDDWCCVKIAGTANVQVSSKIPHIWSTVFETHEKPQPAL